MDAIAAQSEFYVTPETYDAYVAESKSYMADRVRDLERDRRRLWIGCVVAGAVAAASVVTAGVVTLRSGPQGWIMAYDSQTGRMGIVQRMDRVNLPPAVDQYFTTHYVELREGFDDAEATQHFNIVACMSDMTEQKRFAHWFNDDPDAPQQIFARARNHGFRTAEATSDPIPVGGLPNGATRVQVRFRYLDQTGSEVPGKPVAGTATFTVRKDKKAITPCDPAGLVISDYTRALDRGATP